MSEIKPYFLEDPAVREALWQAWQDSNPGISGGHEEGVLFYRVMAAANKRARESGIDVLQSLITISQRAFEGRLLWRVNYGPRDYVARRGGDLIIDVDPADATIKQVLRGQ
jgi:hypothetical protein